MQMKRAPKLMDFVEPKIENRVAVQARIDSKLWDEVNRQRVADGLSWTELLVASLKRYLAESKR